jgi:hypothetical protein
VFGHRLVEAIESSRRINETFQGRFSGWIDDGAFHCGKISRDEFMAHLEEMFKSMDANGDGVLAKDESTCCEDTGDCMGKGPGQGQGTGASQ